MVAIRDGERIDLTASEFALLGDLARVPGRVFTRAQLLDAIDGEAFDAYERAIDAHVKNIRRNWNRAAAATLPAHRVRGGLPPG